MNRSIYITIFGIIILFGIIIYFIFPFGNKSYNIPTNWQTYQNEQFNFTFKYPPNTNTSIEAGQVKVIYLGEDAIPNSEITDGFLFYVNTTTLATSSNLEDIANILYESGTLNQESVSRPKQVNIGNKSGYEFQLKSSLGPVITYDILGADNNNAYTVLYSVIDPNNNNYDQMVKMIINSLELK